LRIASGAVLFGLAARIVVQAVRHGLRGTAAPRVRDRSSAARTYLGLLGITMLNPMTIVYFTALVVDHRSTAVVSAPAGGVFVLAAFAASASWQLTLAGSGAVLGRVLTNDRGRLLSGLVSGLLIGALALNVLIG
jgi:arginine exporter protein ArgO